MLYLRAGKPETEDPSPIGHIWIKYNLFFRLLLLKYSKLALNLHI